MRLSFGAAANGLAWLVVFGLIGLAALAVNRLGFLGLLLLGLLTWLVCTLATLNEDTPTWGAEVFRSRMSAHHGSPEQRAAMLAERRAVLSPPSFYRWCGIALSAIGAAGLAWQYWAWTAATAVPHG